MSTLAKLYEKVQKIKDRRKENLNLLKEKKITPAESAKRQDELNQELAELMLEIEQVELEEEAAGRRAVPVDDQFPGQKGKPGLYQQEKDLEAMARYFLTGELPAQTRDNQFFSDDSKGGYTIPQSVSSFVQTAQSYIGGMLTPGLCRVITSTGSLAPMGFPTMDDTAVEGFLITEKTAMSTSAEDATFGRELLTPFKYTSGLVKVSRELLEDSGTLPDIASYILSDLLLPRVMKAKNRALTIGTGTTMPEGILKAVTATAVSGGARTITRTNLTDLYYSLDPSYIQNGTWMWNATTGKSIRALTIGSTENEQPLWGGGDSVVTGMPTKLEGAPYVLNPAMEDIHLGKIPVLFGDFKKYIIYEGPIIIRRLEELFADTDEIGLVCLQRFDGRLLDVKAVDGIKCAYT